MEKAMFFIVTALIKTIPKIIALVVRYFQFSINFCIYRKCKILKIYIISSNGKRALLVEFLNNIKNAVKNSFRWIVMFGLIPPVTIFILVIALRFLFPYVTFTIFVLGMLWEWIDEKHKKQITEQNAVESQMEFNFKKIIQKEIFLTLREISMLLPVKPPNVETDIDVSVFQQIGIWCANASMLKKQNNVLSSDDISLIKAQIQAVIKSHLENGQVFGVCYASLDREIPVLFVESVFDAGICIQINLVIIDSPLALKYVRRQRTTENKTSGLDEDF